MNKFLLLSTVSVMLFLAGCSGDISKNKGRRADADYISIQGNFSSVSSAAYSAGASAQQWGIFMFVDEDAVYDPQNGAFFDDAYDIVSIDMTTKSVSILAPYGVPVKGVYFLFSSEVTPETIKSALAADPRLPEVVGYVGTRTFSAQDQETGTVTLKSEGTLAVHSVNSISGKTYLGSLEISARAGLDQTLFSGSENVIILQGLDPGVSYTVKAGVSTVTKRSDSMGDIKLTKSDLSSALSKLKDPDTAFPVEIVDSNRAKTLTFTYSPGNIWDWKDLQAMTRNLSTTYTLKNDITLPNAGTDGMTSAGFEPVGTSAAPFTGTFNGNGFKIKNFFTVRPTADNAGLFGYVNGASASIRNGIIELPAGNRDVISAKKYAGTWAGQIHNKAVIDNAGVISADNTGTNTSKIISSSTGGAAGGLVGIAKDSTVQGYFKAGKGTVIESPAAAAESESGSGGLAGYILRSKVTGYFAAQDNTTEIISYHNAGGLVGTGKAGIVTGYSKVVVKAGQNGGGLVGKIDYDVSIYGNVTNTRIWGYTTALVSDVISLNPSSTIVGGAIGLYRVDNYTDGDVYVISRGKTRSNFPTDWNSSTSHPDAVIGNTIISGSVLPYNSNSKNIRWIKEFMPTGSDTVDTANLVQSNFTGINAGTAQGQWTFTGDGKWPAINIGDDIQSAADQPTGPND